MKKNLPAHVHDKKGVLYFPRRGYKTTRIQVKVVTPAFAREYVALLNGAVMAPADNARTFRCAGQGLPVQHPLQAPSALDGPRLREGSGVGD